MTKQTLVDLQGNVLYGGKSTDSKIVYRDERFGEGNTSVVDGHPPTLPPNCKHKWNGSAWTEDATLVNNLRLQAVRSKRDSVLALSDWKVQRHQEQVAASLQTTLTNQQYLDLLELRQEWRDLPETFVNAGYPDPETYEYPAQP